MTRFICFLASFGIVTAGLAQTGNNNPHGPAGSFNGDVHTAGTYDPFTGSARRSISDLVLEGGAAPVSFSRLVSTRNVVGVSSVFGQAGAWRHSWQWSIESQVIRSQNASAMPTSYTVNYPDGRRVTFRASTFDSSYTRGSPGVRDRFVKPTGDGSSCYVIMPDGSKAWFTIAINREVPADERDGRTITSTFDFTFKGIIDPYGVITTFTRERDAALGVDVEMIREPAGRWIKLIYGQLSWSTNGVREVVLQRIEGSDGRKVNYFYEQLRTSTGATYNGLVKVIYFNDNLLTAQYKYQDSNVDPKGRPLLLWCYDIMFAGPMKNIRYQFLPVSRGGVYGQIEKETHIDGTAVSTLAVAGENRTETRGDKPISGGAFPTRTFNYVNGRLKSWTDFKGKVSSANAR